MNIFTIALSLALIALGFEYRRCVRIAKAFEQKYRASQYELLRCALALVDKSEESDRFYDAAYFLAREASSYNVFRYVEEDICDDCCDKADPHKCVDCKFACALMTVDWIKQKKAGEKFEGSRQQAGVGDD